MNRPHWALWAGASLLAFASPMVAHAQTAPQSPAPQSVETEEGIVVTGSRIVRDGLQAASPTTTLTAQALDARAPSNLPDALNTLPQFSYSRSQTQGNTFNPSAPNQGNYLNLRNLGYNRTLVLMDGYRLPPTSAEGAVDLNTLPQMLIERVEVVTGGASAAYGSDAVVGAVNFILDRDFTGLRTIAQGGISTYGDAESYKVGIAAGTPFDGGRGHAEMSVETYRSMGLRIDERDPADEVILFIGGGTADNPFTTISNGRDTRTTFGGLILTGPLAQYKFLPDGTVAPRDLGTPTASSNISIGGDGGIFARPIGQPQTSLIGELRTTQVFGRVSYELDANLEAFAQVSYGESRNLYESTADNRTTSSSNRTPIYPDNAFLHPSVAAAAFDTNEFFLIGRQSAEFPNFKQNVLNTAYNARFGLEGSFGETWEWDAAYTYGHSSLLSHGRETYNPRFYAAVDAVFDGSDIVCRVTLTHPDLYPGCVPINLFGEGAPSQEAIDYVFGDVIYEIVNEMHIAAVNFRGEPFSTWAGPVLFGVGGELRTQSLNQTSNADPAIPWDRTGLQPDIAPSAPLFRSTNVGLAEGSATIAEAYVEALIPLARDLPLMQSLDLNAAVRRTDYSTSGPVDTWKVGLSWRPFEDVRVRALSSRDIAAPSLFQLFQGEQLGTQTDLDPHTGIVNQWLEVTSGNPILSPEVGATTTLGVVYTPSSLPGFRMAVDGYSVLIEDAINVTSSRQMLLDCEQTGGTGPVCDLIIRPLPFSDTSPANFPLRVLRQPLNLAKIYVAGVDLEALYSLPMSTFSDAWSGDLEFRLFLAYLGTYQVRQGLFTPTEETVGAGLSRVSGDPGGGNARLRGAFDLTYNNGPFTGGVRVRATGQSDLSHVQVYADHGENPNVFYTDLNLAYRFGEDDDTEAFLNIRNLFNREPPLVPGTNNPGVYPTNKVIYDVIGTYFTFGVRKNW